MHVDVAVTALSLSPNMDILATSHVDQNGVYLWVNQTMFSGSSSVDSYASGKEVVSVKLPSVSTLEDSHAEDSYEHFVKHSKSNESCALSNFNRQIVMLSLLPKSQWQSLVNLDIIKLRNKPIEPPKKPEKAPFFLPSVPSLSGEIVFKPSSPESEEKEMKSDEAVDDQRMADMPASKFLQLLKYSVETINFSAFTDYMKGLSPSTLDLELRMIQIIDEDDQQEIEKRSELIWMEMLLDYFVH